MEEELSLPFLFWRNTNEKNNSFISFNIEF
jgi:hypothetical protein